MMWEAAAAKITARGGRVLHGPHASTGSSCDAAHQASGR